MIEQVMQPTANDGHHAKPPIESSPKGLISIEELASIIGLTTRTIRTYHVRGLLPPPTRIGRKPHYSRAHVNRMRNVLMLQRRGLPLEAIRALLEPDVVLGERLLPTRHITAAVRADPTLYVRLLGTGVLSSRPDGGLAVRSVRAVLAARALHGGEVPIRHALRTLADSILAVLPLAEAVLRRVDAEVRQTVPDDGERRDDLLEFVVEVFRQCLVLVSSRPAGDEPQAGSEPASRG
jgi:DNA-binding transcriptional MerR regulator